MRFSYKFFARSKNVTREKLLNRHLYKKFVREMLMKLTPGVDFTNILCAAFRHTDPKSAKKTDSLTVFFALLGSALKMLVILPPDL